MIIEELEQLKRKINEVECMKAVINSAKNNIESHHRVFKGDEILIQDNTNKTNPIYITGKTKDEILNLLNKKSIEKIKEFEIKIENYKI